MARQDYADKRDARKQQAASTRRVNLNQHSPADWAGVDPQALMWAIQAVTAQGGALRFGYTRDGGAYAIGIMGDGEPYTEYIKPSDDIDGYLRQLAEAWAK